MNLAHSQNEGMAIQLKHLPHMLKCYVKEIGALNTTHIWAYESLDRRCAAMQA